MRGEISEEAAMQAEAIMTTPVIAVDPSASVADAAALMLANKISGQRDQTGRVPGAAGGDRSRLSLAAFISFCCPDELKDYRSPDTCCNRAIRSLLRQ
ncbi:MULTISPECIES: CBS domain-containing protein [Mesorhizobium]|uniref:CBS domain-containing protein n=2 Tax=Phyllobacteriaceae TaxID=69277 RepID=UPI003335D281